MPHSLETYTGFVDTALVVRSKHGRQWLYLSGWILCAEAAAAELYFAESKGPEILATPFERPDVADAQPTLPHALTSGFRVSIPIEQAADTYRVHFRARLTSGSKVTSSIDVRASISLPVTDLAQHVCVSSLAIKQNDTTPKKAAAQNLRSQIAAECLLRFQNFIQSGERFAFKKTRSEKISVIIPVCEQTHLTYACLENLWSIKIEGLEIMIVDSSATGSTRDLVSRFPGVIYLRNTGTRSFSHACNVGARKARAEFLLFLNNDAFPLPGAIEAALARAQGDRTCGAVGAKLIRPDGLLQEVGSFILPTASTVGRGRGCAPNEPAFNVPIRVDYCSAAFLLTPKEVFQQQNGFDERFIPAYYEDTDYCVRVAQAGYACIVEPASAVLHLEGGTTDETFDISSLMKRGREIFQTIHPQFNRQLGDHSTITRVQKNTKSSKKTRSKKPSKVLVIDDCVPDPVQGQGQGRSALILETLLDLNLQVSWYPTHGLAHSQSAQRPLQVPVITPLTTETRVGFLRRILPSFDTVLVSRPHHMEEVQLALRSFPALPNLPRVVYDAEAVQATREILRFEITNNSLLSEDEVESILRNEIILAQDADSILAASELEATAFVDFGYSEPAIVGYGIAPHPTKTPFDQRQNFLTVGPLLKPDTPNSDGLVWFIREIYPHVVSLLKTSRIGLNHVGDCQVTHIHELQGQGFTLLGQIVNMTPIYEQHRVYLAPTRYSAGIPLKVIEAAANGVPTVITPVLARQLNWRDGVETLVGHDPVEFAVKSVELYRNEKLWAQIRDTALARVRSQFDVSHFKSEISRVLAGW